ncbi:MAG TPA: hypothetical protein VGL35_12315 [Rhizomicrobium sp.]|jgi:hypothetical protein
MTKLSVAGAIRFAYGFAFEQIGAIIALVWLPLLIVAVLQFLPYALGTAWPGGSPVEQAGQSALNLAFSTAALVLYAMNCVAVTRQALGHRKPEATFQFALGWPEWRMFVAIVICGFLLVATIGLYAIGGRAIFAAAHGAPSLAIGAAAYAIAGILLVAFLVLRLIFLLPPIVVAEERVDIVRAWLLSRRNFWRILAIVLAVTIPLLAVQCGAIAAIVGPGLFAPLPDSSTAATLALQARIAMIDQHMPAMIGLALVLAPFSLGLTLGAAVFSYRALAPAKPAPERTS